MVNIILNSSLKGYIILFIVSLYYLHHNHQVYGHKVVSRKKYNVARHWSEDSLDNDWANRSIFDYSQSSDESDKNVDTNHTIIIEPEHNYRECGIKEAGETPPYYAAVYIRTRPEQNRGRSLKLCSGVILDEVTIMTSFRCVRKSASKVVEVVTSTNAMYGTSEGQQRSSKSHRAKLCGNPYYKKHQKYPYMDFAIIKLQRKLTFNQYLSPICLPRDNPAVYWAEYGKKCRVMGLETRKLTDLGYFQQEWPIYARHLPLIPETLCDPCVESQHHGYCINRKSSILHQLRDITQNAIIVCRAYRRKTKQKIWFVQGIISYRCGNSTVATDIASTEIYIRHIMETCGQQFKEEHLREPMMPGRILPTLEEIDLHNLGTVKPTESSTLRPEFTDTNTITTRNPVTRTTSKPDSRPAPTTKAPFMKPTRKSSFKPTRKPNRKPIIEPTPEPPSDPSEASSTEEPASPTQTPTVEATEEPTLEPVQEDTTPRSDWWNSGK